MNGRVKRDLSKLSKREAALAALGQARKAGPGRYAA